MRTDVGRWTLVRFKWSRQSRRFAPFPSIAKFMGDARPLLPACLDLMGWSEPDLFGIWQVPGGSLEGTWLECKWIQLCHHLLFFDHVLVFHECGDGQQHGVLHSISRSSSLTMLSDCQLQRRSYPRSSSLQSGDPTTSYL